MSNIFRVALVGAGGISQAHVAAAKNSAGRIAIVAVVDPHEGARTKLGHEVGAPTFETLDSLLAAHKAGSMVDGIIICTPPSVRVGLVAKALKAGLPVLSEKPIAHTLSDARKIASLGAKSRKTFAAVGYCHRFTPAVLEMKSLVASGKIGQLVRVENVFACDLPGHEGKWFSDTKSSGGGSFLDMGSHSLDLFHFIAGPAQVAGAIFNHKWKGRAETAATVLLSSTKSLGSAIKPGVAGVIVSGWAETSRFTLTLVGTAGLLHYDYERPTELVFKDLVGKAQISTIESHDVRFTRQLVAFADSARSKKKSNLATFADGLAAAVAGDAAVKIARKKLR